MLSPENDICQSLSSDEEQTYECSICAQCTVFTQIQDKVFSLKFGAEICEITLNLYMKHQTRPYCTIAPNETLLYHSTNETLLYHSTNETLLYHSTNETLLYHSTNETLLYHSTNKTLLYHSTNETLLYHSTNETLLYHSTK